MQRAGIKLPLFIHQFRPQPVKILTHHVPKRQVIRTLTTTPKFKPFKHHNRIKGKRIVSSHKIGKWLIMCGISVMGLTLIDGAIRLKVNDITPMSSDELTTQVFDIPEETKHQLNMVYKLEKVHKLAQKSVLVMITLPGIYFVTLRKAAPRTQLVFTGLALLLGMNLYTSNNNTNTYWKSVDPRWRLGMKLGSNYLLAFTMLSEGISILKQSRYLTNPKLSAQDLAKLCAKQAVRGTYLSGFLLLTALLTSIDGTLVSNLRSNALIYKESNTTTNHRSPLKFDDIFSERFNEGKLIYDNLMGNPLTIKLVHRFSAILALTTSLALFFYTRGKTRSHLLPLKVVKSTNLVLGAASVQTTLGLTSYLTGTPFALALMHQCGSMVFIGSILVMLNEFKLPPKEVQRLIRLLAKYN